jgi:hypothetical protein
MVEIKLDWIVEAFPNTDKNISKLNRAVKALPPKECAMPKYIDKKYEPYAKALTECINSMGLKAFYEHIGSSEAGLGELWPNWKITVKKKSESEPLAIINTYPTMHSNNAENIEIAMDKKEKSFNYKDFKSVIEYLINQ